MAKYVVEFIGTFFLVFTIGCAVIEPGAGAMAPLAIGGMLMAMVYAGGHISGAHYNPAITVAVLVRGKSSAACALGYIISQLLAAFAAARVVAIIKSNAAVSTGNPLVLHAFIAEFLVTFALAYVVLNVASAPKTEGNSFYGLAIGFTVTAGAYAVGSISGAAFNPAVAIGITLLGLSQTSFLWVFFVAQLCAGIAAGLAYNTLSAAETVSRQQASSQDFHGVGSARKSANE